MKRFTKASIAAFVLMGVATTMFAGELIVPITTQPTTAPASTQPTTQKSRLTISPKAQVVLDRVLEAYGAIHSLQLAGTATGQFTIDGQTLAQRATFKAILQSPDKFRHEMEDDTLIGSTGKFAYGYLIQKNAYMQADVDKDGFEILQVPSPVIEILRLQNPSLLLALTHDADVAFAQGAATVEALPDTVIDGAACPTISVAPADNSRLTTMSFDPSTNLLRRVVHDLASGVAQRAIKPDSQATFTVDYTTTTLNAPLKDADETAFAWTIPPGARDASRVTGPLTQQRKGPEPTELVGKPAPAIDLKNIAGEKFSLESLKGKTVVLDFWATWCPPCVYSLPHLQKIQEDMAASGVVTYAVNQKEDEQTVRAFIEEHKLKLPVLMDNDGKVGDAYSAHAIPTTVVIDPTGKVAAVFVGAGDEAKLREAIKAALPKE